MADGIEVRAFAKVNLTLEVLGKRADGFHEIASLVHTISLADRLRFEEASGISCEVAGMQLGDEENLVLRAARLLGEQAPGRGARISLTKAIPAAAGLGGGSSDAAATLVALNRLWGGVVPEAELAEMALGLGSDVPLFLEGGAAVMRGRGEVLEALPPLVGQWVVLVVPGHAITGKTVALYRRMRPELFTDGALTARPAERIRHGLGLGDGELFNVFAPLAREVFPGLSEAWAEVERVAGRRFHLSGAGPALFGLVASEEEGLGLKAGLERLGAVFVAQTCAGGGAVRER